MGVLNNCSGKNLVVILLNERVAELKIDVICCLYFLPLSAHQRPRAVYQSAKQ